MDSLEKTGFLKFIDVILRVPPLFFIDEIFRIGFGIRIGYGLKDPSHDRLFGLTLYLDHVDANQTEFDLASGDSYSIVVYSFFKLLLSIWGCVIALCIFMLRTKQLVHVYMFILSLGCIFLSHCFNDGFVQYIIDNIASNIDSKMDFLSHLVLFRTNGLPSIESLVDKTTMFHNFYYNVALQVGLSFLFLNVHLGPYYKMLNTLIPLSFTAPTVLVIFSLPSSIQSHLAVFSALLPLALINYALVSSSFSIIYAIMSACQQARTFVNNFGLSALLEYEWTRLNVPNVLRCFWILRLIEHAITLAIIGLSEAGIPDDGSYHLIVKHLLVTGCETMIAVLGMTSIISYICHYIGAFFQWILQTEDADDKCIGTVSAILFYILALQTGLTELEPDDRFVRLCRNFCLLFTALLHFIHNIVNPLLMSLSASHNPALYRHIRALGVCLFLISYPTILLCFLWSHLQLSTWLLAVSAFSTEVIVKVTVSLMIYSLFLIDAWRVTFWEKLDDYVYYIRAFGNTIEFCFGIFLFFNGAWILLFESGGGVRAAMMCIHAYFNIWCEAKNGWVVFMKRKTAVQKINSLPEASPEQLKEFDDVCAICYQDMVTAKITRCNHYFHGVCLRKWLYVQDRCPLCHEILYKFKPKPKGNKSSNSNNLIVYMQNEREGEEGEGDEGERVEQSGVEETGSGGASSQTITREQGSQTDEVSCEGSAQSASSLPLPTPDSVGSTSYQTLQRPHLRYRLDRSGAGSSKLDSSLDQVRERLTLDLDPDQRSSSIDQATLVTAESINQSAGNS
uniref:Protein TRC8 homolog n=1 Tax=Cacopsylla melanoneura TaxID=428564 RepID=A0A8D8TVT5_9HEMI